MSPFKDERKSTLKTSLRKDTEMYIELFESYQHVSFRGHDYTVECEIKWPNEGEVAELVSVTNIVNSCLDKRIDTSARYGKAIINLLKEELVHWDYQAVDDEVCSLQREGHRILAEETALQGIKQEVAKLVDLADSA